MDYLATKYGLSSYKVDIIVASYGVFFPDTTQKGMLYRYDRYLFGKSSIIVILLIINII